MRLKRKSGVPLVLTNHNERFIDHLNASVFAGVTETDIENNRRRSQLQFLQNSRLTLSELFAKKSLNLLSTFLGEDQSMPSG